MAHQKFTSAVAVSTIFRTSGLPSLVFVWPSNSGLGTLTDTIAERPSRMCSPSKPPSPSLRSFSFLATAAY